MDAGMSVAANIESPRDSRHVVIAGGGMVGLSLALLLDQQLPSEVQITLVEGFAPPPVGASADQYHPSFDARSTALSFSTASIYRELGIWDSLTPGLGAIRSIHVSSRGRFGSSLLTAAEQRWDALGWVVENPCLGQALLHALRDSRVDLRCPARVRNATPLAHGMRVDIDANNGEGVSISLPAEGEPAGDCLDADLLVVADGAQSTLREKLGFFTRSKTYGQNAIIANIAFDKDHCGCAFERFTSSGPLALLPLPPSDRDASRMALVWTLPPPRAEQMLSASEEDFAQALTDAFGLRLGRPLRIGKRGAYPLALTEAVEQWRRGCVILGNAAHALHPVAGQGFNLALRDAAALAEELASAAGRRQPLGDPQTLARYGEARGRDQAQTIAASDGLPALFMSNDPLLGLGRDLALSGMDLIPALRRFFVHEAAGMAALEARGG